MQNILVLHNWKLIEKADDNVKAENTHFDGARAYLTMAIPNMEVRYIFENNIMEWFKRRVEKMNLAQMHQYVLAGEVENFM